MKFIIATLLLASSIISFAETPQPTTGKIVGGVAHDMPSWFKQSFLEFAEDAQEAADENKHVLLFFHLNDCPYCSKMVDDLNANKENIIPFFDVIAINIKGDREIALNDMETLTERELAQQLGVKYTPTIIFLNAQNEIVSRTNGYRKPSEFATIAEFIKGKHYLKSDFTQYKNNITVANNYNFIDNKTFKNITDLSSITTPLAVIFESSDCVSCEYFHTTTLQNEWVKNEFANYTIVRFDARSDAVIITPKGKKTTMKQFANDLQLTYRPGVILFNNSEEKARIDGFLYTWHFSEMLRFVAGNYQSKFPSFGEYLGFRQQELIEQGKTIDIAK
jgi:thioredoxin-related protein